MGSVISMKALLESGVHFGHRTNKWDPYMRPFIFTERNGIHIIDLQQTVKCLTTAYNLVRDNASGGGSLLFIGTKRQAQETIKEEAIRCGMPYVTERWLGGMLTNWSTMFQRIAELERLERLRDSGEINRLTKKEGLIITREIARLEMHLSGIRKMKKVPEMVFVVDVMREATAIHEANVLHIPVVALVDTNCDPRGVDYVIPSNDDAIRAIKLLVGKMADAVLEGKAMRKDDDLEAVAAEAEAVRASMIAMNVPTGLEEEIDDVDLLGEATLAKLTASKPTPVVEETPAVVEEIAAAVAEPVVAKVETPEVDEKPVKEKAKAAKTEEAAPVIAEETPKAEEVVKKTKPKAAKIEEVAPKVEEVVKKTKPKAAKTEEEAPKAEEVVKKTKPKAAKTEAEK